MSLPAGVTEASLQQLQASMDSPEALEQWLLDHTPSEVAAHVSGGWLAVERVLAAPCTPPPDTNPDEWALAEARRAQPISQRREACLLIHQERRAQHAAQAALAALTDDLAIVPYVVGHDDPEKVAAALPGVVIAEDGYLFAEGVTTDALTAALHASRA